VADRVQQQVVSGLDEIFTDQASGGIQSVQQIFEESSRGIVAAAAIAAIWAMSRTMHSVMGALSIVYGVPEARGWLKTRLLALMFSVISVFAVASTLTLFVVGPLFGTGATLADKLGFEDGFVSFWQYVRYPLAFVVLACFAAVVFHLAPNGRRGWRLDFPGAALTTLLWLVVSVGLRLYIELASAGNGIYAVLGGALIVLVWLYLLGMSLIIGGELNVALIRRQERGVHLRRR
jgi:membrane protein